MKNLFLLLFTLHWFNTADDLVRFLNGLSQSQQATARIVVAPSTRNILGFAGSPYGLIFEVK